MYGNKIKTDKNQARVRIIKYIKGRVESLNTNVRMELREAVLEVGNLDIVDIFNRMSELKTISKEIYFLEAAKVVERTSNILKGAKNENIGEVDKKLFREDLEQKVWDAYLSSKDNIQNLIDKEEYREATKEYGQAFYKVLHEFFDKVLVNVEDRAVRVNRLAMMRAINRLYTERIADLAKLPQIVVK